MYTYNSVCKNTRGEFPVPYIAKDMYMTRSLLDALFYIYILSFLLL